ncbi:MAG: DUF4279 domain-containing protein [Leisingera sp.]
MPEREKLSLEDFALSSTQDRQYAYFAITSDTPLPEDIEKLPLRPSRYWNAGDKVVRGRIEFERTFSRWAFESGLRETDPLEEHIESLLRKLLPVFGQLEQLPADCKQSVVCVTFSVQCSGFILEPAILKQLAKFNLHLEYDFYSNVDPHDELADLRSLVPREC